MICPLHNGNPPHDAVAPRFAVSAPNSTVMKASASGIQESGVGIQGARAAAIRLPSRSIAVARCRITMTGVSPVFTVTAPSST